MYAGTKVNWHEVLMSSGTPTVSNESLPLFLCAFSADKGTESITNYTLADFQTMYGSNADYFKYGQPLIQAHSILQAGGRVLGKRLVADDATLANLVITAEITVTTDPTDGVTKTVSVKYGASTVTDAKTFSDVVTGAKALETASVFPILVITDNGRGESVKAVRIAPNYDVSKTLAFCLYEIQDIEGTVTVESVRFSMYPDGITYVGTGATSTGLIQKTTSQFFTGYCDEGLANFVKKLAEETGYTEDELYNLDILNAKTLKGVDVGAWTIDETGLDLAATYGLTLQSGSNGAFGSAPFAGETPTTEWTTQAKAFFDGTFSEEIYDTDQYKIDFCVDANYPKAVKNAIVELATFREDFFYFRDLSLDINSIQDIQDTVSKDDWAKSPFTGDYISVYDVLDTYSRKQITVTMTYGLAPLLVSHYSTNVAAPVAGEFNNFVITNVVDGTLRFVPRVTPKVNQKEILDELKVNYVNYSSEGNLTVQSSYTSQDHEGPLSYSSNVIVTQMCVKDIRRYVPKIRFMVVDSDTNDFSEYKSLITDNVLSNYKKYFNSIELVYTADDAMTAQKIFNASIQCYYKNFAQGEIFDIYAIEGSPESNPVSL